MASDHTSKGGSARAADASRTRAWAGARRVEDCLAAHVAQFESLPAGHPHAGYADFARLYLHTTRQWLAHLSGAPDREFPLHVIPPFFALYERHVLARLDAPLPEIGAHWRDYHRRVRLLSAAAPRGARFLAVCSGIRAHSHHDMGVALCLAEVATGQPVRGEARRQMFDLLATRAFAEGALGFCGRHPMLEATRPVWIPVLHHWRLSGYRRAVALSRATDPR